MTRDFSLPGRSAVRAKNGMITTSHPVASAVGMHILAQGGNAVDAAIAAVATLSIAEPHMTGIGGDCFALVSGDGSADITALNGSGRAPQGISVDVLKAQGIHEIERYSPHAVTVPGAVDAWWRLHQRFGSMDWDKLFAPAIAYANEGIAVHDRVARDWAERADYVADDADAAQQYLKSGRAYKTGEVFAHPKLARTYDVIAREGRDGFYTGAVAEEMVTKLQSVGGFHTEDDFRETAASFVLPIKADYKGHTIWECPPNGQGVTALMMIKLLEQFDLPSMDDIDRVHVLAEAAKIAYSLRDTYVADPGHEDVPMEWLLSDATIKDAANRIDMARAQPFAASDFPTHPHTVYLAAVDGNGQAISLINSIFNDFGAGISTPEYGVLFQSRGMAFRVDENHANKVAGGKRPLHTIIPGMITSGDKLVGPFGVMGGQYQSVGHGMFISNLYAHGMDPQQALDAPRSFAYDGVLKLEGAYGEAVAAALKARGHEVEYPAAPIGGGQAILKDLETGVYVAGSDPRKDGQAIGY